MNFLVNGITMNVEIIGKGKPLIMLHGNQENHHIFDSMKDELAKHYELHLIDSRNHGESDMTNDFSFQTMVEDTKAYIDQSNIQPVYFYGFSDGGIIGLILASLYPHSISKLMVSGVNVHPSGLKKTLMKKIKAGYEKNKSPYLKMMMDEPNITDKDLNHVHIPVFLTLGEHDLITRKHTKSMLKQLTYGKLTIYEGLDHGGHLSHYPRFITDLINFFD